MTGVSGTLTGKEQGFDRVDYSLDYAAEAESVAVVTTFDLGFGEFDVYFSEDEAEQFIVKFRDELVRAKQARLEWETDTDPDSGVAETGGGGR